MTMLLALFLVLTATLPQAAEAKQATRLEFREILAPSTIELKPSDKLRRLQGQRVRIIGFMAEMEHMPDGYFYLCSRPILCDESGGGIGELPIDAVRVVVRGGKMRKGQAIKFLAPLIEVSGVLELGGQSEMEQDSWAVRVLTDSFSTAVKPLKTPAPKLRKNSKR